MTTHPNLAREFPDFDQSTLPLIPPGFEDQSWRNDTSPRFHHTGLRLTLWIDYADPALAEFPEERATGIMKRFAVYSTDAEGAELGAGPDLETDDWAEVLALIAATPRAPFWTLGARHEYENGQEAFVAAVDAEDSRFAVVRKGERFEAAFRDAAMQDEADTWVNPTEDEDDFASLDEATAAMTACRTTLALAPEAGQ